MLALAVNEDMACRARQRHTFSRMEPRRLGTSRIAHCTPMFNHLARYSHRFAQRRATWPSHVEWSILRITTAVPLWMLTIA